MSRMRSFLLITLLGGLAVILPLVVFVADAMRVVFACGAGAAEVLGGELAATAGAEDAR